jgi:hypothetical protein
MASFLRNDDSSRASKALAKRQSKAYDGADIDFETVVKKELVSLLNVLPQIRDTLESDELTASFYSTETMGNMFQTLLKLRAEEVQDFTMEDVLLVVGGTGLAFTAPSRTLVDPWIFRVEEVHTDCFLSQPDWCASRIQGRGVALVTPGTKRPITGVVPLALSREDSAMLEFYTRHLPSLARMQSSVAMMGMISDLPFTDLALQAAALLSMAETMDFATCTSREFHIVKGLLRTINQRTLHNKYFADLRANLSPVNFTGDKDITGVLKPLLVWLEDPQLDLIPELVRLELRWRVKSRAKMLGREGEDVLKAWLDLQAGHNQPLQPLFVPEPAEVKCYDQLDVERLMADVAPWLTLRPLAFTQLHHLAQASSVDDLHRAMQASRDFGDLLWLTYLAVETFHRPKIVDVTKGENETRTLVPLLKTRQDMEAYLCSIVRDHFTAEYQRQVAFKNKQESDVTRQRHLEELRSALNLSQYLALLNANFTARDSDVLSALLVTPSCTLQLEKIWLFVTGHFPNKDTPVWNEGHFLRLMVNEWILLREVYNATARGQRMWVMLMDLKKTNNSHVYRNGPPNRHGYSNDCPSFWALGFETIDAMREAYTDTQWRDYLQQCHANGVQKAYL